MTVGLTSANNYVSMLTREQLSVLRSIRPGLLYEFLQEVAKLRSEKRMRRTLPNVSVRTSISPNYLLRDTGDNFSDFQNFQYLLIDN